jgi:hypothetical protein
MAIDFSAPVKLAEDVLVREIDGEAVILVMKTERYLGLDPVGSNMMNVLTGSASVEAAYEALLEKFDVEPDVLRRDLEELIGKLVEAGVFEAADFESESGARV